MQKVFCENFTCKLKVVMQHEVASASSAKRHFNFTIVNQIGHVCIIIHAHVKALGHIASADHLEV